MACLRVRFFLFVVEVEGTESERVEFNCGRNSAFFLSFFNCVSTVLLTSAIQEWTLAYASSSSEEARDACEMEEKRKSERRENVEPKCN